MVAVSSEGRARTRRVFELLFDLSRLVASGSPLAELLERVAAAAAEVAGASAAHVVLADEGSEGELASAFFGAGAGVAPAARDRLEGAANAVLRGGVAPAPGQAAGLVALPLHAGASPIGALAVLAADGAGLSPHATEALSYLASSVVKDLGAARLYRLAITDPLTRAFNRQYLYQRLPVELERARRYAVPFSALLLDVDELGELNRKHGAAAGDHVLRELARICSAQLREIDAVARYGGEEFFLFLPHTDLAGAKITAQRLLGAVAAAHLSFEGRPLEVTLSAGLVQLQEPDDDAGFLARIDAALLRAKQLGRDRVEVG